MTLGLCVTPTFFPDSTELKAMNSPYHRSILYKASDVDTLMGLDERPIIITLNNQCQEVKGDWSGWDVTIYNLLEYLKRTGRLSRLAFLGCGNELDLWWSIDGSTPPMMAADLTRRAKRIAMQYGVKVAATSLAGPEWINYLRVLAELLGDDVDYYDMHPYGQKPAGFLPGQSWMHGNLKDCINQVKQIGQKPVVVTEYGVKISDAGGEYQQGNFLVAANDELNQLDVKYSCWFAYSDMIGTPEEQANNSGFGLKNASGQYRHAYHDFIGVNKTVTSPPNNDDIYTKWGSLVGRGLLDMMKQDNTEPAQRVSTWLPLGVTPSDIEECYGKNGTRYYWLLGEGKGFRARSS